MREFLKKILSFEEICENRNQLTVLGIRIKFPKREAAIFRKKSPFHFYKKNNLDITTLPKAEGKLRDIQLANLGIIKVFDKICKDNNLTYWLFAGSALGQVRHKGFIPWDDDIDIAMPREDYDKVLDIVNKKTSSCIYAELFATANNKGFITKLKHKKSARLFVDIFAVDFTGKIFSKEDQILFTKKIKEERQYKIKNFTNKSDVIKEFLEIRNKYTDTNAPKTNSDILIGVEWDHGESNWFLKYDTVYPIKNVEFDGCILKSMNKPEQYLKDYYGDYMTYPKKLALGHSVFIEFNKEDLQAIKELKGIL